MSSKFFSSRAFSLPKKFYQENYKKIDQLNQKNELLKIFDNNRYVERDRVKLIALSSIKLELFGYKINVEYQALCHCSNNVTILCKYGFEEKLSLDQMDTIIKNWIPSENIFTYHKEKYNVRNLLNYGFLIFLLILQEKDIEFKQFQNLQDLDKYKYEDVDIQEIEKIYTFCKIKIDNFFFIPTMYGSSFIIDDNQEKVLKEKYKPFYSLDDTNIFIERNFAFIKDSSEVSSMIYLISYFNLLKHIKNRIGSEISLKLDDVYAVHQSDYSELLNESIDLQQELTVNYDEFNNVNIWHNSTLLELSKIIRSENGWNMANEFEENRIKLHEFIELTTEMSKGKLQSFMDSVSLLIGVLGIFAIFDLIHTLNSEPYTGIHWSVSFLIIMFCLPFILVILAKKSDFLMKIFNKLL